jgi:hypothetical protein
MRAFILEVAFVGFFILFLLILKHGIDKRDSTGHHAGQLQKRELPESKGARVRK